MNNTTYSIKKNEIESKWYIIDAANKPLGRVATEAAKLLIRIPILLVFEQRFHVRYQHRFLLSLTFVFLMNSLEAFL